MLKVGLIGCGHIAETYFRSQKYFNNIEIISCADINAETSKKCAQEYNIEAQEVDDILVDKKINIVLNLTNPQAHYEIIKTYIKSAAFSAVTRTVPVSILSGIDSPLANLRAFSTPM